MLVDDKLGQGFIGDADMVLDFRHDFGNEREELEVGEIVHGCGAASGGEESGRDESGDQKVWMRLGMAADVEAARRPAASDSPPPPGPAPPLDPPPPFE